MMGTVIFTARHSLSAAKHPFAPGDLVVQYQNGEPHICMVVGIEDNQHLRVTCRAWPKGYTAVVRPQEVVRLACPNP